MGEAPGGLGSGVPGSFCLLSSICFQSSSGERMSQSRPANNNRILVIDDNPSIHEDFRIYLVHPQPPYVKTNHNPPQVFYFSLVSTRSKIDADKIKIKIPVVSNAGTGCDVGAGVIYAVSLASTPYAGP